MTKLYYFSGTGHSRELARFFAATLHLPLREIRRDTPTPAVDTALVVFPVYCQSIPAPVKAFLPKLKAERIVLIASYGRMGYGNVLYEAARLVKGRVIAGAYVPCGHTYIPEELPIDFSALAPILERLEAPREAKIPRSRKDLLAYLAPGLRSRLGVKIEKTAACKGCGYCNTICPMETMRKGKPGHNCLRCLRCASECPRRALNVSYHPLLTNYLKTIRKEGYVLYL